jgi:hypothetical protein
MDLATKFGGAPSVVLVTARPVEIPARLQESNMTYEKIESESISDGTLILNNTRDPQRGHGRDYICEPWPNIAFGLEEESVEQRRTGRLLQG